MFGLGLGLLSPIPVASGYRYIRIYITANNGNQYTSIQELELATVAAGADITAPSMPTLDDAHYQANSFGKAIDNSHAYATDVYVTDGTLLPHWGRVDLGTPRIIVELRMWSQNYAEGAARAPKDFLVQGSNDATNWTTIKGFTNVTGWVQGTGKTFSLI